MKHPQVLVFENGTRLLRKLKPMASERRWVLRAYRSIEAVLRALGQPHPTVLVIKGGTDVPREISLLERASLSPAEPRLLVVLDVENSLLAGLCGHLGADYVVQSSEERESLPDLVAKMMHSALECLRPRRAAEEIESC
ncbi:MAG: hypothetical protein KatS3mg105_4144 [Gemmatales bacterium]|nr:MAG: hypothetical protein KatS3mg105_4144 [Gemmatales bacterium]